MLLIAYTSEFGSVWCEAKRGEVVPEDIGSVSRCIMLKQGLLLSEMESVLVVELDDVIASYKGSELKEWWFGTPEGK